jgi:hypothetical protein
MNSISGGGGAGAGGERDAGPHPRLSQGLEAHAQILPT